MQDEPEDLDGEEGPPEPLPSRKARLLGGGLGAAAGLLLGLAVSHTAFDDRGRAGFCGLGMGLGVPVGVFVAYLFQARRQEPPPE